MSKNRWKSALVVVLIAISSVGVWFGRQSWVRRQWFDLQKQQMATIQRLGEFPPDGCAPETWKNVVVSPYNVWGNVTYHPDYSEISNDKMRVLKQKLDEIIAETTTANSFDSVDRVFELLLQQGRKQDFISGYREEFRGFREETRQRLEAGTAGDSLRSTPGTP